MGDRPRPGGGSGHVSHSSTGHSMNQRSVGGHRTGGGGRERPGMNVSDIGSGIQMVSRMLQGSSYGRGYGGYFRYGGYHGYGGYGGSYGGGFRSILPMLIMLILLLVGIFGSSMVKAPNSTTNRTAISSNGFEMNCVVDELGYMDVPESSLQGLSDFHMKTGVQPYVYLKAYDKDCVTDADKQAYANIYFEQQIQDEKAFLIMYFGEADDSMGYVANVTGREAESVMDAEALQIFWTYWDSYWASDRNMESVVADTFRDTADRIMKRTVTVMDIAKYVMLVLAVIVVGVIIVKLVQLKYRRQREAAEETERILRTPLHTSDSAADRYMQDRDD